MWERDDLNEKGDDVARGVDEVVSVELGVLIRQVQRPFPSRLV
jgi:hypothetical protein